MGCRSICKCNTKEIGTNPKKFLCKHRVGYLIGRLIDSWNANFWMSNNTYMLTVDVIYTAVHTCNLVDTSVRRISSWYNPHLILISSKLLTICSCSLVHFSQLLQNISNSVKYSIKSLRSLTCTVRKDTHSTRPESRPLYCSPYWFWLNILAIKISFYF